MLQAVRDFQHRIASQMNILQSSDLFLGLRWASDSDFDNVLLIQVQQVVASLQVSDLQNAIFQLDPLCKVLSQTAWSGARRPAKEGNCSNEGCIGPVEWHQDVVAFSTIDIIRVGTLVLLRQVPLHVRGRAGHSFGIVKWSKVDHTLVIRLEVDRQRTAPKRMRYDELEWSI